MKKIFNLFLVLFFVSFDKTSAQNFNKNLLLGLWEFGSGNSYTSRNFVNDSTLIVYSTFGGNTTHNYELDISNPEHIILIEKYKEPDSVTTVQTRLQIINNNELNMQTLRIKHFNIATKEWGDFSMPPETAMTFKRAKK